MKQKEAATKTAIDPFLEYSLENWFAPGAVEKKGPEDWIRELTDDLMGEYIS